MQVITLSRKVRVIISVVSLNETLFMLRHEAIDRGRRWEGNWLLPRGPRWRTTRPAGGHLLFRCRNCVHSPLNILPFSFGKGFRLRYGINYDFFRYFCMVLIFSIIFSKEKSIHLRSDHFFWSSLYIFLLFLRITTNIMQISRKDRRIHFPSKFGEKICPRSK